MALILCLSIIILYTINAHIVPDMARKGYPVWDESFCHLNKSSLINLIQIAFTSVFKYTPIFTGLFNIERFY